MQLVTATVLLMVLQELSLIRVTWLNLTIHGHAYSLRMETSVTKACVAVSVPLQQLLSVQGQGGNSCMMGMLGFFLLSIQSRRNTAGKWFESCGLAV